MSTEAAIRVAAAADAETVIDLYEWLFAPPGSEPPGWDREAGLERLRATLSADDAALLLAELEGEPVGICSVYMDLRSVRYGERAWIEDLAVDPGRRSQGVGEALMAAAFEWARRHGASHVELDSGDARADAHRFYERLEPSWSGRQFSWWLE